MSNYVPVINTNVNRFKEILTCIEINEYVLTMYLLTLSDASLYISFLRDLENVPRGGILKDTFCLPGVGG